jgi:amino acid transporter
MEFAVLKSDLVLGYTAAMSSPSITLKSASHWHSYIYKVGIPYRERVAPDLTRQLAFGRDGSLAIWSFMCVAQIMMTASLLLPASRQAFAFARDGALPFSQYFYSVNKKTQTPVRSEFARSSS